MNTATATATATTATATASESTPHPTHAAADAAVAATVRRDYHCVCGAAIFLRNSQCVNCGRALGYVVETGRVEALEPAEHDGQWQVVRADPNQPDAPPKSSGIDAPLPTAPEGRYLRCANLNRAPACNWLVAVEQVQAAEGAASPEAVGADAGTTDAAGQGPAPVARQCLACSLNRTVPDESDPEQALNWSRVEVAKRRLVSSLLALGLPVKSRLTDDPERGLVFDLLAPTEAAPQVLTGHDEGLITLNLAEADDAYRERVRQQMHEPYRTMLGHLRHEVGHYYWDRLVRDSGWLQSYRDCFGDERLDYSEALNRHYQQGAPADWPQRYISAYASMHPWEDWAESWAHYLHMTDGLGTARSFGLEPKSVAVDDMATPSSDDASGDGRSDGFDALFEDWLQLTRVLNEMSRSMGQQDFYPFYVSPAARAKLHFVHRVITQPAPAMPEPAAPADDATNASAGDPANAGAPAAPAAAVPASDQASDQAAEVAPG